MNIVLQLYARLRDEVGRTEVELDLPAGATVATALATLYAAEPALAPWDRVLLTAMGVEYVPRDQPLHEGAVLLLFPPVQGG